MVFRYPGSLTRDLNTAVLLGCVLLLAPQLRAQDFSQNPHPSQPATAANAALIQQANDALAAGDFPTALRILTNLNAQTPNNPDVLYDLGLTAESLGDSRSAGVTSSTAEAWYRKAIAANPLLAAPHVALGLLLARSDRAAEAHAELLTATRLEADPDLKARAYRALARLDLQSHSTKAASTELLAALNLTPEAAEDILLAADIAQAEPDLPAAEKAYRRYLALKPAPPDTLNATAELAHVLLAEGHPADAETLLNTALTEHPADPTLTSQLAAAYLASGDPERVAKAAPLLESLHNAHPQDIDIGRLLARVYVETGHPDQADSLDAALLAEQARSGKQADANLLVDRAEALMRLHRPGEAETLLKQAIANPAAFATPAEYGDAALHLAFAAAQIDDAKTTLQALSIRSTVLPPTPPSLFLEATASDTLHESSKAADLYRQFLAAAHGDYPDQETQAKHRLGLLQTRK